MEELMRPASGSLVSKKPSHNFPKEDETKLLEAFDIFDANNDGVIDKYEMLNIL